MPRGHAVDETSAVSQGAGKPAFARTTTFDGMCRRQCPARAPPIYEFSGLASPFSYGMPDSGNHILNHNQFRYCIDVDGNPLDNNNVVPAIFITRSGELILSIFLATSVIDDSLIVDGRNGVPA
ncbi:hypothetical protein [Burkholderia ubonensis]|uniref:hypothetical protein n=1 Tax=Burkholderia ubonensis TaxID=101571 RepID=UPI001160E060|nr:hypothetical protein [Burkholderia ubonensis]